jgi:hypothetical protein
MDRTPHLSKSRYLAGQQCALRLWLGGHSPELATPPDAAREALFASGTEIGRRAHALFPGGVLVDADDHAAAVARTRALLDDPSVPAIFEAAIEHDGVRIRVDILERLNDAAWGFREVKAGTRTRDVHLDDVALQHHVLTGAGLRVASTQLIQVDDTYVRDEGAIDWTRFFVRRDVGDEVTARLAAIGARITEMHHTLTAPERPAVEPSPHCWAPYRCEFWAHCTAAKPDDWVVRLPGSRGIRLDALHTARVERIRDIPDDFPLSAVQARVRAALRSGRPSVSAELAPALVTLAPPLEYLDFETMGPAVPLYPGTRPYERVPFQWSLHHLERDGILTHREFLADGGVDPRRAFAAALVAAVGGSSAPIAVYSSFEDEVLGELADALPDLVEPIAAVRARLVDLYALVRAHVYHPAFDFSFSLKSVAPALAPGFGYDDLEAIAHGAAASLAFGRGLLYTSPSPRDS